MATISSKETHKKRVRFDLHMGNRSRHVLPRDGHMQLPYKRVFRRKRDLHMGNRSRHVLPRDGHMQLPYKRVFRQKHGIKESNRVQAQRSTDHESHSHNLQELATHRCKGDDSNFKTLLLNMIVKDLQPLRTMEGAWFQHLTRSLQPSLHIPLNASWVQAELQRLYRHKRMEVQAAVNNSSNLVLSTELWSSNESLFYLTVSCHLIDEKWELKSYVLDTAHLLVEHTADKAVQQLLRIANEWNITEKTQVVVTNVDGMKKVHKNVCRWIYIPCFAHTLDKVFGEAIGDPDLKHLLRKCQHIVAFFHQNNQASQSLQEYCSHLKLQQNELTQSTGLKWLPTHHMLNNIILQWPAIFKVFVDRREDDLCLNENERKIVEDIVDVLNILKEVTEEIGRQGYSPISNIIPLVKKLKEKLNRLKMKGNRIAPKLSERCDYHIGNIIQNRWFRVSTALDPQFKTSVLLDSGVENEIRREIQPEHSKYDTEELVLQKYWKIKDTPVKPLEFWRNKDEFEKLATVARKYLTVVSTAIPMERVYQLEESLIVNRRSCLEPENVNMMVFLNSN
ncbi:E3 SUMO-protein ligase ZBED1-like isoform X2 [Myxocyprinus asiaticus]|uniref:E3 SUMO-protein ligase ZBED1-like isoform X2 n=1 Tax=Myxocyprinus asiaticus TaxID=70543 RepID=UPI0022234C58|nr:E3 SUMO-protein ligase ZBED1-like isoform X2 [Myxocyprinus asiaticus]